MASGGTQRELQRGKPLIGQAEIALEMMIDREPDAFVQKALQLVVDGTEPDNISSVMYVDLNMRESADTMAAKVFEGMGVYSPTLGIIGAVLGLMAVLQNLADPSKLGHGIAAAFTATIYGIGLANLFFLPVAAKLKERNPGFDGKETHKVEGGVVTFLFFWADNVTDLSPVRALTGLQTLNCAGSNAGAGDGCLDGRLLDPPNNN